MAEQFDFPV